MLSISAIDQVGDRGQAPVTQPSELVSNQSALTVFRAALQSSDEISETSFNSMFEVVGAAAKRLRDDRHHVDLAFEGAVDTLDPWAMGKAAVAMSEYNHETQLATKLLNHATQSIDQLARGS